MRNLLYIVILLVIAGCSYSDSQHTRRLDEAEAMMPTDPVEAMNRLNGMDVAEFSDSATLARWALLYSEAMVANRIMAPTDTIVEIAIDYYSHHNLREQFDHASRLKALLKSGNDDALASALYLQREKEFFLYRERMARQRLICVSLTVLLIAVAAFLWQRQRIRLKDAENNRLLAEALSLKENNTNLQGRLADSLTSRFNIIDGLCETYYESQGTKTERKAILEKVKDNIASLRSDAGLFAEMEDAVNACRGGMLTRLRQSWPDMKPDDYKLYVYLASGLSNRTIALLLDESIDVVYKRKSRLKSRVSEKFNGRQNNILIF